MTRNGHRLLGLLGLVLVVACDDGGASKTEAKKSAAPPAKTAKADAAENDATKVEAGSDANPDAKTVAAAAPAEGTPEADAPADPSAAGETPPTEEPAAADDGAGDEPAEADADPEANAADDPSVEGSDDPEADAEADEPAVASSAEVNGISLGSDAELLRLVLAHDVVDRQPVDPAVSFPAGHKVNLFVEARNESGAEQVVRVTWETVSNGRRSPATSVRIPTRKLHRTRAYRTVKRPGEYRCIVLGEGDAELAVIPFTISE